MREISRERYWERYREKDIGRKISREPWKCWSLFFAADFVRFCLHCWLWEDPISLYGVFKKNVTFRQKWKYLKIQKFDRSYTLSLSRHEQVCLMRLRFEKYFSYHWADDGRSISRNAVSLNILVHDMINLLHYEHWTDKQKYFYVFDRLVSWFAETLSTMTNFY